MRAAQARKPRLQARVHARQPRVRHGTPSEVPARIAATAAFASTFSSLTSSRCAYHEHQSEVGPVRAGSRANFAIAAVSSLLNLAGSSVARLLAEGS